MIKIRVDSNIRKKIEDAIYNDATSNNKTSLKNCLIEHEEKLKNENFDNLDTSKKVKIT